METTPDDNQSAGEIKTPIFSASFKGKDIQFRDIILVAVFALSAVTAYAAWEHKIDENNSRGAQIAALKEIALAARENNCIMRFEQSKRESVYEFCRQLARTAT